MEDKNIAGEEELRSGSKHSAGRSWNKNEDTSGGAYDWLQSIVSAMVICVLIFVFLFRVVNVIGSSMVPTLENGDKIIVSNLFYKPEYGDIVVVRKESFSDEAIVKRVIATGGQTIDIDFVSGTVTVDGKVLEEDYIADLTHDPENFNGEITVPEGYLFVMGDNRNRSTDSRSAAIGFIDEREIIGKALFRLLPAKKFGSVY